MSVDTVALFLALLAVAAEIGTAVTVVAAVLHRLRPGHGPWRFLVTQVGPNALHLAAVVAGVAMAGSLYFSEVAHFTPCNLCWYQRCCMYSAAIILVAAAVRRDHAVRPYVTVLTGLGLLIASYHVLVERFPTLESDVCDPVVPCTLIWVEKLGYLTIPTMSLSAFAALLALCALDRAHEESRP